MGLLNQPLFNMGLGLVSESGPSFRPANYGRGVMTGLLNARQNRIAQQQDQLRQIQMQQAEMQFDRQKAISDWAARQPGLGKIFPEVAARAELDFSVNAPDKIVMTTAGELGYRNIDPGTPVEVNFDKFGRPTDINVMSGARAPEPGLFEGTSKEIVMANAWLRQFPEGPERDAARNQILQSSLGRPRVLNTPDGTYTIPGIDLPPLPGPLPGSAEPIAATPATPAAPTAAPAAGPSGFTPRRLTAAEALRYRDADGNPPPPGVTAQDIVDGGYQLVSQQEANKVLDLSGARGALDTLRTLAFGGEDGMSGVFKLSADQGPFERAKVIANVKWENIAQNDPQYILYKDASNGLITTIVRAWEKGTLADQDVERAKANIPDPAFHTKEVAEMKFAILESILAKIGGDNTPTPTTLPDEAPAAAAPNVTDWSDMK